MFELPHFKSYTNLKKKDYKSKLILLGWLLKQCVNLFKIKNCIKQLLLPCCFLRVILMLLIISIQPNVLTKIIQTTFVVSLK